MIIINLTGGLGNQMFQYALGRVLAEINHDTLKLDTSSFNIFSSIDTLRCYELDIFKLSSNLASRSESMRFSDPNPLIVAINQFLRTNISPYPVSYTVEKSHNFDPQVLEMTGDIYLRGFWQSEKYFSVHRDLILGEFSFKSHPTHKNAILLKSINSSESISVHVRRGDYVSNVQANKFHGTCDIGYYKKAIKDLAKRCKNPSFFVFSDDIEWCKKNLPISYPVTYVSHNQGESSWEDMRLMSKCKHNIIANSSFSWWGAWLNTNPSKIVIAPKRWYRDSKIETNDLIPQVWKTI